MNNIDAMNSNFPVKVLVSFDFSDQFIALISQFLVLYIFDCFFCPSQKGTGIKDVCRAQFCRKRDDWNPEVK